MSALAAVVTVALSRVVANPYLWPRAELNQGRVEEFMQLYRDSGLAGLPALDVVSAGDRLLLADGWHRHQALTRLDSPTAMVQMLAGDGDPVVRAYRHALLTASTAAMPLTREELGVSEATFCQLHRTRRHGRRPGRTTDLLAGRAPAARQGDRAGAVDRRPASPFRLGLPARGAQPFRRVSRRHGAHRPPRLAASTAGSAHPRAGPAHAAPPLFLLTTGPR